MNNDKYLTVFKGYFRGLLRWNELDRFWETLRSHADAGWYIYAVGETPPDKPVDARRLCDFIDEIDALLRREHDEDYCGIVYADSIDEPHFIKIYDPNNLGSSCGSGSPPPPLPGWVLSTLPPVDLKAAMPPPANRRRWWQKLISG